MLLTLKLLLVTMAILRCQSMVENMKSANERLVLLYNGFCNSDFDSDSVTSSAFTCDQEIFSDLSVNEEFQDSQRIGQASGEVNSDSVDGFNSSSSNSSSANFFFSYFNEEESTSLPESDSVDAVLVCPLKTCTINSHLNNIVEGDNASPDSNHEVIRPPNTICTLNTLFYDSVDKANLSLSDSDNAVSTGPDHKALNSSSEERLVKCSLNNSGENSDLSFSYSGDETEISSLDILSDESLSSELAEKGESTLSDFDSESMLHLV